MHNPKITRFVFIAPLFLAAIACGDTAPCDETKTCNVDPSSGSGAGVGTGGGATTSSSGVGTGGMGTGGTADTTPPTVMSVSPGVGEIGVAVGDKLTITFSEPMDQTATEAAFSTGDFGVDTMIWLDASTLEITPTGLAYNAGGPSVMANVYVYQVKGTATDLAGNALGTPFDGDFGTLREVTANPPIADQNTIISSGSEVGCSNVGGRYIGWKGGSYCRHLISFDLAAVPSGAEVQSANLTCSRHAVVGDPFSQFSTDVVLEHVDYPSNNLALAYAATGTEVGIAFDDLDDSSLSLGVATEVAADLTQNKAEAQFRIQLANEPTVGVSDQYVDFLDTNPISGGCSANALTVTYLAP